MMQKRTVARIAVGLRSSCSRRPAARCLAPERSIEYRAMRHYDVAGSRHRPPDALSAVIIGQSAVEMRSSLGAAMRFYPIRCINRVMRLPCPYYLVADAGQTGNGISSFRGSGSALPSRTTFRLGIITSDRLDARTAAMYFDVSGCTTPILFRSSACDYELDILSPGIEWPTAYRGERFFCVQCRHQSMAARTRATRARVSTKGRP